MQLLLFSSFHHSFLWFLGCTVIIILVLLAAILWRIRPFPISDDVPGPPRTAGFCGGLWSFAVPSSDWDQWPTYGLGMARRANFRTWGAPTPNIGFGGAFFSIVSPSCLEHVLKSSLYVKGNLVRSFAELLGTAVFTTDGEEWKFHRHMVAKQMMMGGKRTIAHGAATVLEQRLALLEEYLLLAQEEGKTIDIAQVAHDMILDVFVQLTFGVDVRQILLQGDHANGAAAAGLTEFRQAFDELLECTHDRMNDLFWEIKQRFRIGNREKRIAQCTAVIDRFAYSIIETAKKNAGKDDDDDQQDVLRRFIRYSREKRGVEPSNKELRDFVMTFVMAGRDTTAAALTWTLWELTRHPAYVDRMRAEIDAACCQQQGEQFTLETTKRLPVTTAVIMESLRLHPTAPESFRFATKDDTLPDGTFIPAGSTVMLSPYSIAHSELVWGEDVDDFKPSRWLDSPSPERSQYEFPVFSAGPRSCPGKSLALMELRMTLAFLVSKFDFEDTAGHDGSYHFALVMKMKNGFPVTVHSRRR